ncbi:3-phosphoserine/phosphohydroxythreonine transaminase [Frateuria aurantia]
MSRVWNFSAGPAALPIEVLQQAQAELLDWNGTGASVMELSHRGKPFMAMAAEAEADLRRLLQVPEHYAVLFLQGGATQHFAQLPMNLASPGASADYVLTGHWSEKAASEAAPYVKVRIAASSKEAGYRGLPAVDLASLDPKAAYLHYVANETIHGIEWRQPPPSGELPLIADMSSNILSAPLDVERFGVIYAGAQKNIGPSGLVVMIIRRDLLQREGQPIAKILRYREQAAADSMLNTPNTWGWYLAGLTFKWILAQGGLAAVEAENIRKSSLLYQAIDQSGGFYRNPVDTAARSRMNIPFTLHDPALDSLFLEQSAAAGLMALKGHKAVGGMRASLYNAVPLAAVQALVTFMAEFVRRNG